MGTRRSRHNKGRKPIYKEHRQHLVGEEHGVTLSALSRAAGIRLTYKQLLERNANDIQPINATADEILAQPRYANGGLYNNNLTWMDSDIARLKILCDAEADLDRAEIAMGRPKKALAWRARDIGLSLPTAWGRLVRSPYKPKLREPTIVLQYPYIVKSRPRDEDLLRANALVPKSFNPDMRADICQNVMLALFEGTVTLDELEKNKDRMRYFVAKFYKDQRPFQEVTGIGSEDDERAYYDIAAEPYAVWRTDEISEHRAAHDAWKDHTPAEQEDAIYNQEIAHTTFLADRKGIHLETADVRTLIDAGDWKEEIAAYASSPTKYHVISRAKERYGLDVTDAHIDQLAKFCRYNRPARVHPYSEVHEFKRGEFRMAVVYSRKQNMVLTVLPLEELDG